MKYFKDDSPFEKKVQHIETEMQKLGLTFSIGHNGITVSDGTTEAYMRDVDGNSVTTHIPRQFDSEKLVIIE